MDELAHTNAPGSRHTKRYQDVEELLQGLSIHVYTTVNVQHLESLHDLVSSITGIEVSERIPDRVLTGRSRWSWWTSSRTRLMKRLQTGKVYRERQARQALSHFSLWTTLRALREIAMRRTADQLNHAAVREGNEKAPGRGAYFDHLSSAPSNARVIRTAARMAGGLPQRIYRALCADAGDARAVRRKSDAAPRQPAPRGTAGGTDRHCIWLRTRLCRSRSTPGSAASPRSSWAGSTTSRLFRLERKVWQTA